MNSNSRRIAILAGTGAGLLILRAAVPTVLTWLANVGVQKIPGYRGRVRRVRVDFRLPCVELQGLSLAQLNGAQPENLLEINSVILGSHWKDIFSGSLIGYMRLDSPRLLLNVARFSRSDGDQSGNSRPGRDARAGEHPSWRGTVQKFPAFRISSAVLTEGEVRLKGVPGQSGTEIKLDRLNLSLDNITNSAKLAPTLMAKASCNARVMVDGTLELRAEGYPFASRPTFNVDFETSNVDLTKLKHVIETSVEIEVLRGIVDLYIEAAAADGHIQGYVKPIFDHLELETPEHSSLAVTMKAWAAEAVAWLGKNKRKDRIATRIDFEGSLEDPDLNITDATLRFIRNGFLTAERASLEHRIWFSKRGKTADEVRIHYGTQPYSKVAIVVGLLKETFSRWSEDSATRMAAALSYYTAFSMAPLLILAIAVAGLVLGREAAQGKIVEQISGLVGKQSAVAIQSMIQAANRPSKGIFAGIIGIVSLMAGAIGVLSELKSALNRIWRTQESGDVKEIVKKNAAFVGMLFGIGFLLTVSLIVSAAVSGLGRSLGGLIPVPELFLHIADFIVSVGIIAPLFAGMFKFLPNTVVEWRDVWIGAFVTSLLFNLGKLGLGLYIGKSAVASSYGAAGSILVLLLWVYYSGLILYFGAEFTKVFAERYGSRTKSRQPRATPKRFASAA
jgi:membrane protein